MSDVNYLQQRRNEDKYALTKRDKIVIGAVGTALGLAGLKLMINDKNKREKAMEYLNSADLFYTTTRNFTNGQIYDNESGSTLELPEKGYVNLVSAIIDGELGGIPEGISRPRLKTAVEKVAAEMNGINIDQIPGGGRALALPDLNGNGSLDLGRRSEPLYIKVGEARERGIKGENGFKKGYLDSLRESNIGKEMLNK